MNEQAKEDLKEPIVKFNLYKAWPMIVAFIVLTIWIVKLEAKVDTTKEDLAKYKESRKEEMKNLNSKIDTIQTDIRNIAVGVGTIQGRLEGKK